MRHDSPQRIVLKHAARLRAGDARVPLALSSHPGRAIVPVKNHFDYLQNGSRRFRVNEDGTVAPAHRPDLVLSISYYSPLLFVDRASPNRAVF